MTNEEIIQAAIAQTLERADREVVRLTRALKYNVKHQPDEVDAMTTGASIGSGVGLVLQDHINLRIARAQSAAIRNAQVEISAALGFRRPEYEAAHPELPDRRDPR